MSMKLILFQIRILLGFVRNSIFFPNFRAIAANTIHFAVNENKLSYLRKKTNIPMNLPVVNIYASAAG